MEQRARFIRRGEPFVIRKGDQIYALPAGWALSGSGSYEWNNKLEDRAFSHGSDMTGDGKVKGRQLEVEFSMKGATENEHDEMLNEAYRAFSQTDYDLLCGRPDRLYHVAGISKIQHSFEKGFKQRWSDIKVTLLLADPFRYEAAESRLEFVFTDMQAGTEMIVNNRGSADTPITFTFTPDNTMSSIVIYHEETEEMMTIADALLTAPATLTVNSQDGTVWRGSGNAINAFSGQFLYAQAGTNHFRYSGAPGKIEIAFRNRWYV